jgi:hypothetical protein
MPGKKKSVKRQGNNRMNSRAQSFFLPEIKWSPSSDRRLRFYGTLTQDAGVLVTRACILSLMLSSTSGDSHAVPLFTGARIKGVRISLPGVTAPTVPQSVAFQWLGDVSKPDIITINNMGTMGTSRYLVVPKGGRSAMWSRAGSLTATLEEPLFTFNSNDVSIGASTACYVDIDLEVNMLYGSSAAIALPAASAPQGISYAALDNLGTGDAVGTWIFFPLGALCVAGNTAPSSFSRSGG